MTEALLLKLLDIGFTAAQIGMERQAVIDAAQARIAAGDSPDEVASYLVNMRNEARKKAEDAVKGFIDPE